MEGEKKKKRERERRERRAMMSRENDGGNLEVEMNGKFFPAIFLERDCGRE